MARRTCLDPLGNEIATIRAFELPDRLKLHPASRAYTLGALEHSAARWAFESLVLWGRHDFEGGGWLMRVTVRTYRAIASLVVIEVVVI
jgi:hypothetical protein